ncbi:MAG: hypothetical protein C0622_12825 [Desulfuromonas sp.]|nr:MAG: hypothetical protein C0622_12825 [Desulfuromonas sp.]
MKKLFTITAVNLVLLLLFTTSGFCASAEEAIGTVVAVRGEVSASNTSGERRLTLKSKIFLADTIRTGQNGRLQLLFKDNTLISLGAGTTMKIAEYEWDADKNDGRMTTRVEAGTFRILGGMITKHAPQNFSTETPAATIGIRGSMYAGSIEDGTLRVIFLGGKGIYLFNEFGEIDIDMPGFGSIVEPGQPPRPPQRMDIIEFIDLVEGLRRDRDAGERDGLLSPENAELLAAGTSGVADTTPLDIARDSGTDASADQDGDLLTDIIEALVALLDQVNEPPLAEDDLATTDEDVALAIDVALNDSDDGTITGWTVTTTTTNGTLTNNNDGTFTYTPDADFYGLDTFVYEVTDDAGATDTAQVEITVTSINDPPAAGDDTATTDEDIVIEITVTLNDADDGTITGWAVTTEPTNGTLINNNDGTFTYTPDADFYGLDTFVYEVTDDAGTTDTAQVEITVASINDPPVAGDDSAEVVENVNTQIDVSANDSDLDGILTTWDVTVLPTYGTLTNNGDGTFDYQSDAGFVGEDSFTYSVTDDGGETTTATVTITSTAAIINVAMRGEVMETFVPDGGYHTAGDWPINTYYFTDGESTNGSVIIGAHYDPVYLFPSFLIATYDPEAAYTGYSVQTVTGITKTGELGEQTNTADIYSDNKGEFAYLMIEGDPLTIGEITYKPQDFIYVGVPTLNAEFPTTGIDHYSGNALSYFVSNAQDYSESMFLSADFAVNWGTNTLIVRLGDGSYLYGNLVFDLETGGYYLEGDWLGGGWPSTNYPPYEISTMRGDTVSIDFFGSDYQGIGISGEGDMATVYDQYQPLDSNDAWSSSFQTEAAGMRSLDTESSPTGNVTLVGSAIGLAEYMNNPQDRTFIMSDLADSANTPGLTITIDRDTGALSTSFSLFGDHAGNIVTIENLSVDGTRSAYIDDQNFIAALGCTGDCLTETPPEQTDVPLVLDLYGNYMVTAADALQFSDYMVWGTWDIVYTRSGDYGEEQMHVHQPGSLWIAGEATPTLVIDSLITTPPAYSMVYEGPAYGIMIDDYQFVSELTNGWSVLKVDFNSLLFSGSLSFDQTTLTFGGSDQSDTSLDNGFLLNFADTNVSAGDIEAYFYGPNADSVGGRFYAELTTSEIFQGIFGGNLTTEQGELITEDITLATMVGASEVFLRDMSDGTLQYPSSGQFITTVDDQQDPVNSNATILLGMGNGYIVPPFVITAHDSLATYSWNWYDYGNSTTSDVNMAFDIPTALTVGYDSLGEFFVYEETTQAVDGFNDPLSGTPYTYHAMTFGGFPTQADDLPVTGIDTYTGDTLASALAVDTASDNQGFLATTMYVNWDNGKIFGIILDPGMDNGYPNKQIYFYGDINDLTTLQFVSGTTWTYGLNDPTTDVFTLNGSTSSAQFFGSLYQGFGLQATGNELNLYTTSETTPWSATAGLFREPTSETSTGTSRTINGFFIGVDEDLGGSSSYLNYNYFSSTFAIDLDAENGTVTTSLFADFGGSGYSAYIDDDRFIAEIYPDSTGYSDEGGFLVTADPSLQTIDYASWGYWNLVQNDNTHIHTPGAFWIAGETTPTSALDSLVSTNYTGSYSGPAYGVVRDTLNTMTTLTGGTTTLDFNFGTSYLYGTIAFDQSILPVDGTVTFSTSTGDFDSSSIFPGSIGYSVIYGTFFGPNAESMGGSFQAAMPSGTYSGIFGGNQLP